MCVCKGNPNAYYVKLHTEGLQNRNALIIISYSVPCPLLNAHFPLSSSVRSLTHGSSSNETSAEPSLSSSLLTSFLQAPLPSGVCRKLHNCQAAALQRLLGIVFVPRVSPSLITECLSALPDRGGTILGLVFIRHDSCLVQVPK